MEVQRADPKFRTAVLVAAAVAGLALWLLLSTWLSALSHAPRASALSQLSTALALCLALMCLVILAFGAFVWRLGAKVQLHALLPPPGSRVLRDTPILRGASALRRGRRLRAIGGALVVCGLVLIPVCWRLHASVATSFV